ncbi:TPA: hypothetical protein L9X93_004612 [Klebsiella pneumoniae]|nr:hypothetical protein [Klebsiella pneumoniae]HBR5319586.1 hypothetical protein [Klebsiella pneumoniae]
MAKSSAERKAAQRARQSAAGNRKIELVLDAQELDMLARNCAARRPGRDPYEMITSCPCVGDSQCWVTRGWHETKLSA